MNWGFTSGLFFVLSLCSFVLSKVVCGYLQRRALLDLPNERSSHSVPTPRGGGLAVCAVIVVALLLGGGLKLLPLMFSLKISGLVLFLAVVSWLDDLYNLSPLIRFGSHIGAVVLALYTGLVSGSFSAGFLNPSVELFLIGLGWVWFINLFNFMDGIDGIASVEAIAICLGGLAVSAAIGDAPATMISVIIILAAVVGFLPLNWSPAKIFLGDVGSIPLGFLCAWVLLTMALGEQAAAAFILSLVFLSDATITILKRLLQGEKIWQPHRQHFYQKAVQRGLSHQQTTLGAVVANLALIGLALWSASGHEAIAVLSGFLVVGLLFAYYLKFPVAADNSGTSS